MNLTELASEFVLGEIPTDELKDRAYQAVLAGHDSPSLCALAGAEKNVTSAELRDLFVRALRELSVSWPNRLEAAAILKRVYARRVVDCTLSPRDGASRIVGLFQKLEGELPPAHRFLGDSFGISSLVGSYYQLDDTAAQDPTVRRELEEEIVEACSRLARGEQANAAGP